MSFFRVNVRRSLIVLAAATLLLAFSFSSGSESAYAGPIISVGDEWFCDASFEGDTCETMVPTGTLVTWSWVGSLPHNTVGPDWASSIQTSGTFARTFNTQGEFSYICTVHPITMKGKIIVSDAAVGGIAELPVLNDTGQLSTEEEGDRAVLFGAIIAAVLVSTAVVGAGWLTLRRRT